MGDVIKAAEDLHSMVCGNATLVTPVPSTAVASTTKTPTTSMPPVPRPEEEAKIPDHRLQYQKNSDGQYTAVELKCTLSGVADMSGILLDVSEKHIRLSTCKPFPRYVVNAGPFPVLINPSAARAKFSKKREELSISVPTKKDN